MHHASTTSLLCDVLIFVSVISDGKCDDGTMTSMRMLPNLLKKATHKTQHPAQDTHQAKSTQD